MRNISSRIIAGIVIVGVGLLLLANVVLPDFEIGSVFALVLGIALIAIGVSTVLSSTRNVWWALALALLGVALILDNFDLLPFSPWSLIAPTLVIALGLSLLTRPRVTSGRATSSTQSDAYSSTPDGADAGRSSFASSASDERATDQNVTAVLGGSEVRSTARAFRTASMTAVLGSAALDLTRAGLASEVRIEVLGFMGGVEIRLPAQVRVRVETTALLGGIEDRSISSTDPGVPVVVITGQVILGGLEIRN